MEQSSTDSPQRIAIAQVVKTHGLRGEVRVRAFNPDTEMLVAGYTVELRQNGKAESRTIRSARRHGAFFLLTFSDCDSIEQAEGLLGAELWVPRDDLPETGPNEIYHFELIGMRVVTIDGRDIGSIVEMMDGAGADICVVRGHGEEHLIPMVEAIVREIDRAGRRVVIDPIPGLLGD